MTASLAGDRYVVISADVHCGASMDTYREYLESRWHGDYDEWRANYALPWADLEDTESDDYRRNFDSSLRQRGSWRVMGSSVRFSSRIRFRPFSPRQR